MEPVPVIEVISVAFPKFAFGAADVFAGGAWPQISTCLRPPLVGEWKRTESSVWLADDFLDCEGKLTCRALSTWPTYIKVQRRPPLPRVCAVTVLR